MLFWIENAKARFILYILLIYYHFYKYKCMYMYLQALYKIKKKMH